MNKTHLTLIATLLLSSCSSFFSDKKILEGTRESIFFANQNKKAASKKETVTLDPASNVESLDHVGANQSRKMSHATIGDNLSLVKTIDLEISNGREILCPPIVVDSQIFVLDNASVLKSYDFTSGDKLFEIPLFDAKRSDIDASFGGGITHFDGVLYVATSLNELVAVSLKTKAILWRKPTFGICRGAPVVNKDMVCVSTENSKTTAYQTKTGQQIWSHEGIPESASVASGSSPASSGAIIISPYNSGEIAALKPHNGAVAWTKTLGGGKAALAKIFSNITANPVIDGEFLYAGSLNSQFSKIGIKDGDSLWDAPISALGIPLLSGNAVFLTTSNKTVVALSKETGYPIWETQLPATNPDLFDKATHWSAPALGSGKLYTAGTTKQLFVLDAISGKILQTLDIPDVVVLQPIIVKNTLLLLTHEGRLLMYK